MPIVPGLADPLPKEYSLQGLANGTCPFLLCTDWVFIKTALLNVFTIALV